MKKAYTSQVQKKKRSVLAQSTEKIQSNEAVDGWSDRRKLLRGGSGSCLFWCTLENLFCFTIYLWNTKGRNGQYTKELWIDRRGKSKSLAWNSVLLALGNIKKVREVVEWPRALGDIRWVTYIYGMFYRFRMIDVPDEGKEKKNDRVNKKRRSNRKYKSKVVVKEAIAQILQAWMLAPSSKNCQLWKFVVATESAKAEVVKKWKKESFVRKKTYYSG